MLQDLAQINMTNHDKSYEFIVKRSELSDVIYFSNSIDNNSIQSYNHFFNMGDLEKLYETSYFSVTVTTGDDELVGLFIFNDVPEFSEHSHKYQSHLYGQWEDWFNTNFDDPRLNGKNSIWLIYLCLDEKFLPTEDSHLKIYEKVHLSLYTTLTNINSILFMIAKNEKDNKSAAYRAINILTSYLYKDIPEININPMSVCVYKNIRKSVFPLIEIRDGIEEDHDDLEYIFKEQTHNDQIKNFYEDYFIAKMIFSQNDENKVLVGQVKNSAIGMLALGTNVDVSRLIKNFELEKYDNLLKQDYMQAVNLKRKQIISAKEKSISDERRDLLESYKKEIMSCEKISQRIYLQEYIKSCTRFIDDLEEIEKEKSKEMLNAQFAKKEIDIIIENFLIKYPDLEPYDKKIVIDSGSCLLTDEFNFFIETLEFFGLPKNYMQGSGHWTDFLEKEAQKKAAKEQFLKKLGNTAVNKKKLNRQNKKENDGPIKPSHFDFSPLVKAMRLFKDANVKVRSVIRKIILDNKNLIASFFVDELGEPSNTKCFDIMNLKKKLMQAKINYPSEYADMIGPIFLCFGNLPYEKRVVMRIPEEEFIIPDKLESKKKKKEEKKKKDIKDDETAKNNIKKEIPMTLYEVSISDFFKSVEVSFEYDKLLYELGIIKDDDFTDEYNEYIKKIEAKLKNNESFDKSEYKEIKDRTIKKNLEESEIQLEKYSNILEKYDNELDIPPINPEVINAFCVQLFFIEQAFESRSSDFLLKAFECFPDKDYLIITQPHSFFENSLLDLFIKIEKKLNSLFQDVLYIIHRESLMISIMEVANTQLNDLVKSAYLFENMESSIAESMYKLSHESINSNLNSKYICVTAKIHNSNIGIFLIAKEANVAYYNSHFNIRDFSNIDKISKYMQGRIVYFLTHKNFKQYSKLFIKEISRLLNKITLYYELASDTVKYPEFLNELVMTNSRRFPGFVIRKYNHNPEKYNDEKIQSRTDSSHYDEFDEVESNICLFMITKKMFAETKIANNNRIVIVGASDTGISFIESLLSIRYLSFSYIYLIAPGGLLYHHIEDEIQNLKVPMNNYKINEIRKLLLEHRIKVVDAKVKDIKPLQKYVQLEDSSILYYDYLILTLGLQDTLGKILKDSLNTKIEDLINKNQEIHIPTENQKEFLLKQAQISSILTKIKEDFNNIVISVDDTNIYSKFNPTEKLITSFKRNPKFEIILYGRSINILTFIQGLLKRGAQPYKIKLVLCNLEQIDEKSQGKGKKDSNQIEEPSHAVNANYLDDTKEIEDYILDSISELGVKVYKNYNFHDIIFNENNDPMIKYKFIDEGTDNEVELAANVIVTAGGLDVDRTVFDFIHENRLVYNGRAIIDRNFKTADKYIFAAGKLCKFSQGYNDKYRLMRLER